MGLVNTILIYVSIDIMLSHMDIKPVHIDIKPTTKIRTEIAATYTITQNLLHVYSNYGFFTYTSTDIHLF